MGFIEDVQITRLRIIENVAGDILHALKQHELTYQGFGEAYFSTVNFNNAKGWKMHRKMILNIVVPIGAIQFVLFDGRKTSQTFRQIQEIILSKENYQRLTVPPGIWMAFKGLDTGVNMLLNIASIPHDPLESDNMPLNTNEIPYSFL